MLTRIPPGLFERFSSYCIQPVLSILNTVRRYSHRKSNRVELAYPWEYVQTDLERNLHRYLGVDRDDISLIVIGWGLAW